LEILTKSKRILIVTECFYPEEFKINNVALSWKDKGYGVDVLTLAPTYPLGRVFPGYKNSFFRKYEYQGVNIFRLRTVTGYRNSVIKKILKYTNFMIFGSIVAIFIGRRYDYVFGFNLSSLTSMLPAVIIRKLYKKPVMFWVQDVWPDSIYAYGFKKTKILSILLNAFVKFIYHNVTAIAISSKGFEEKLKPYTKKGLKFSYAPNWADNLDIDIDPIALSTTQKVHFTFAGNVGKVQNLENIINAFCLLTDEYQKKVQLNIIGDGSNLINLKKLSNDKSNIIFFGKQKRKDMAKFYKASDFLIVSLIDEPIFSVTIPAKTQTYIAAKKPILAIINGDVADIVNDNNLGISADPSNVNLIKEAFEKCTDMPENKKYKFTINNTKLLEMTFNKDRIINKMTRQLIGCND
jgi:glycosyltransferase involved in cell wall biosynthesis